MWRLWSPQGQNGLRFVARLEVLDVFLVRVGDPIDGVGVSGWCLMNHGDHRSLLSLSVSETAGSLLGRGVGGCRDELLHGSAALGTQLPLKVQTMTRLPLPQSNDRT